MGSQPPLGIPDHVHLSEVSSGGRGERKEGYCVVVLTYMLDCLLACLLSLSLLLVFLVYVCDAYYYYVLLLLWVTCAL